MAEYKRLTNTHIVFSFSFSPSTFLCAMLILKFHAKKHLTLLYYLSWKKEEISHSRTFDNKQNQSVVARYFACDMCFAYNVQSLYAVMCKYCVYVCAIRSTMSDVHVIVRILCACV